MDPSELRRQAIKLRAECQKHFDELRTEDVPERLFELLRGMLGLWDYLLTLLDELPAEETPIRRPSAQIGRIAQKVKSILDEAKKDKDPT